MTDTFTNIISNQQTDLRLIKEFLNQKYDLFADFLDRLDIEPTEAEIIINSIETISEVLEYVKRTNQLAERGPVRSGRSRRNEKAETNSEGNKGTAG